jgi:uncharacterized protein (TIGR01777 family)
MRLTYGVDLPAHDPATVFAWHERPGALERLTPPWGEVEVVRRSGGIRDGGEVEMRIRRGPSTFHWHVRHRDYEEGRQFRDEQVSGPLKSWLHTHRFLPLPGGGTRVEDDIELEPPLGAAGAAFGPAFIRREADRLFRFRLRRLATDLDRHAAWSDRPRLKVAITGASGLIGSNLTHFLTTGGHEVIRLVRDSRTVGAGAAYWNPATGEIDAGALTGVDAVVHLSGTSIGAGRWTDDRKRSILRSRVQGTELIARTIAEMSPRPRVLVSASAVGYYGDRGNEPLDEQAKSGAGFLAEVCRAWEGATRAAERAGVRVVHLRQGVVLSPAGGALGQMLLPFKVGLGGRIGSGEQYVSWIDLDDLVALHLHVLYTDSLVGPVNATAPHPVTNATFTSALGRALGRPTIVPVPALAMKALFGQLGTEALLWGQRVMPRKVVGSGFSFVYEGVGESLRFQLGRES